MADTELTLAEDFRPEHGYEVADFNPEESHAAVPVDLYGVPTPLTFSPRIFGLVSQTMPRVPGRLVFYTQRVDGDPFVNCMLYALSTVLRWMGYDLPVDSAGVMRYGMTLRQATGVLLVDPKTGAHLGTSEADTKVALQKLLPEALARLQFIDPSPNDLFELLATGQWAVRIEVHMSKMPTHLKRWCGTGYDGWHAMSIGGARLSGGVQQVYLLDPMGRPAAGYSGEWVALSDIVPAIARRIDGGLRIVAGKMSGASASPDSQHLDSFQTPAPAPAPEPVPAPSTPVDDPQPPVSTPATPEPEPAPQPVPEPQPAPEPAPAPEPVPAPVPQEASAMFILDGIEPNSSHTVHLAKGQPVFRTPGGAKITNMGVAADVQFLGVPSDAPDWFAVVVKTSHALTDGKVHAVVAFVPAANAGAPTPKPPVADPEVEALKSQVANAQKAAADAQTEVATVKSNAAAIADAIAVYAARLKS